MFGIMKHEAPEYGEPLKPKKENGAREGNKNGSRPLPNKPVIISNEGDGSVVSEVSVWVKNDDGTRSTAKFFCVCRSEDTNSKDGSRKAYGSTPEEAKERFKSGEFGIPDKSRTKSKITDSLNRLLAVNPKK